VKHSPFVVVVAGGTASGKTTICRAFAKTMGASLIAQDRYYLDVPEPRGHNYDHPDALETSLLTHHVAALKAGQTVCLPVYQFHIHKRSSQTERVEPSDMLIVEGILTLDAEPLAALADLRVFVDAPADIRLARRLKRDVAERGRDVADVIDQYLGTVRPGHEKFVEPSREVADVILDGCAPVEDSLQRLLMAVTERR